MTLHLSGADIRALATDDLVLDAARAVVAAESADLTALPPRIDVPTTAGFLRAMPAVLDGAMGVKVMTLVHGVGTRYLVLLYDVVTGELTATFDADELTALRTAAYTIVAGETIGAAEHSRLALLGTGFEAAGHLRLAARRWPLAHVTVFSRSAERRAAFAARMTRELRITVTAASSMPEALADAPVALLATKSREPVVHGGALATGAVVLSIGSTRPDLRELDRDTLARTGTLIVDDPRQVMAESGDIIDALDHHALPAARITALARAHGEPAALRRDTGRDLLVFKSVGTALQDLALARALLAAARSRGAGRDLGALTSLKPFATPHGAENTPLDGTAREKTAGEKTAREKAT